MTVTVRSYLANFRCGLGGAIAVALASKKAHAGTRLRGLTAISIFSIIAIAAFAQDELVEQASKPTLTDVQHLAEVITGDKSMLRAYCELGGIHDEMQQALDDQDANAIDALIARADALEQRLGTEYERVIEGLERMDFNTAEGQQIADVFKTLQERCE
jgi:hypothetical protein